MGIGKQCFSLLIYHQSWHLCFSFLCPGSEQYERTVRCWISSTLKQQETSFDLVHGISLCLDLGHGEFSTNYSSLALHTWLLFGWNLNCGWNFLGCLQGGLCHSHSIFVIIPVIFIYPAFDCAALILRWRNTYCVKCVGLWLLPST